MKKKEIRTDLYTKTEYAKKVGITPTRVKQMIDEGKLQVLVVNGAELIKVS